MVITERKRQANRENSLKSTGPKTEEGKRIVSMNAVVHGARAESHILPGDEPQQVRAFFDAYIGELSPADGVQLSLATRMAGVAWKIERLSRAERTWMLEKQARHLNKQQQDNEWKNCGRRKKEEAAPLKPLSPEQILASSFNCSDHTQDRLWDLQLKLERHLLSMYRLYRQLKKDGPGEEVEATNLHESARINAEGISSAVFADDADNKCKTEDEGESASSSASCAQSADQSLPAAIRDDLCGFVANTFSAPNKANVKLGKIDDENGNHRDDVQRE